MGRPTATVSSVIKDNVPTPPSSVTHISLRSLPHSNSVPQRSYSAVAATASYPLPCSSTPISTQTRGHDYLLDSPKLPRRQSKPTHISNTSSVELGQRMQGPTSWPKSSSSQERQTATGAIPYTSGASVSTEPKKGVALARDQK